MKFNRGKIMEILRRKNVVEGLKGGVYNKYKEMV